MAEPLDAIKAFHNAFRADMSLIDKAALDMARGKHGLAPTVGRFLFLTKCWFGMPMGRKLPSSPH